MSTPYYQDDSVTIYHGDAQRAYLPELGVLVTDPPYPNNAGHFTESIEAARYILTRPWWTTALVFWTELERAPIMEGLELVGVHIWHRSNVNGRPYEPVYHFTPDGQKRRSDVLRHPAIFDGAGPGCQEYLGHPTQKPVALMRQLIAKTTGPIVDPFMGVGSTLVAAKEQGRRAIGIDLNPEYLKQQMKRNAQTPLGLDAA